MSRYVLYEPYMPNSALKATCVHQSWGDPGISGYVRVELRIFPDY
jgi:hypothetical protein